MKAKCSYCNKENDFEIGKINRAKKMNLNLYCDRKCAELGRRSNKTETQKKEEKRLYDLKYRNGEKREEILQRKRDYHLKTYDVEKAKEYRKERMPKHLEYCRTKKYKEWKKTYDKKYRAKKNYGEYWESHLLIEKIEKEYDNREVKNSNNLINKSQNRKKLWKQMQQNSMQKI